jgi:hypothetical protein
MATFKPDEIDLLQKGGNQVTFIYNLSYERLHTISGSLVGHPMTTPNLTRTTKTEFVNIFVLSISINDGLLEEQESKKSRAKEINNNNMVLDLARHVNR